MYVDSVLRECTNGPFNLPIPSATKTLCNQKIQGKLYTPPPPPPIFLPKGIFQGRGVGVYKFRGPHAAGILYAPLSYTPPTLRRVFSGVGGWGCIKFGPVKILLEIFFITVTRFEIFRINFRILPDTYCICVSCVTLPAWDHCPC